MPKTLFIDLDGTLVRHNYTPFDVDDVLLPGALEFLLDARRAGHFCILTTNRSAAAAERILARLRTEAGFVFERTLFDLPVGVRVLINDTKGDEVRAVAIPVPRDQGLEGIRL